MKGSESPQDAPKVPDDAKVASEPQESQQDPTEDECEQHYSEGE